MIPDKISILEKSLKKTPDNPMMLYLLGMEYLKLKEYLKAKELFRRTILLDPGYSAAYRDLGKAYSGSGEANEAISIYEEGIKIAEAKLDIQTAKEMKVFKKRLENNLNSI